MKTSTGWLIRIFLFVPLIPIGILTSVGMFYLAGEAMLHPHSVDTPKTQSSR